LLTNERVAAVVNTSAIAENIRNIKKIIHPNCEIMAIIKADAYGHGACELADIMLNSGVASFGVAIIDEAIELRQHGINAPIVVMGHTHACKMPDIVRLSLIQTVYSYDMACKLNEVAEAFSMQADVHIKIDTGMGRLGFLCDDDSLSEIIKIKNLKNINIVGLFTHLSSEDSADKTFSTMQNEKFSQAVSKLARRGINNVSLHISNSAGVIDSPHLNYNYVRPGIILFGHYPSCEVNRSRLPLVPAMSWVTHVSHIKTVPPGTTIGYGHAFVTARESVIATIPVGYADGYPRSLGGKANVLVGGQLAPIVGKICMDQFMVDITDIDDVQVEDEVVLFGKQGNCGISVDELAEIAGTINYEIICGISKRVPRVYC